MTDTTHNETRTDRQATDSEVLAWNALPDGIAAALLALILSLPYRGVGHLQEAVRTRALDMAAALHREGQSVEMTARAAMRLAERQVTSVHRREVAAGMGEDYCSDDTATTISHWAPQADLRYRTTYADLTETVIGSLPNPARTDLTDLTAAMRDHGDTCPACAGTGARPTLPGILSHTAGLDSQSPAARRNRDAAKRALAMIPGYGTADGDAPAWQAWEHVAALLDDAAPLTAGEHPRHGKRSDVATPITRDHGEDYRTVVTADDDARETTALEDWTRSNPACRHGWRSHVEYDADGMPVGLLACKRETAGSDAYALRTPITRDESGRLVAGTPTRKAVVSVGEDFTRPVAPGETGSHKPVVSPRKRAGGQTGPTVPVRLSR